ncbi:saccharopine dehydrogenase family protein [Pseudomonadota bacterium]
MSWLIYGANGYTGNLTAREAVNRGMKPVLAGRNETAIRSLADELGLDFLVFGLDDASVLNEAISDFQLVLHCAGPFSVTSEPMIAACLEGGAHYLDITGEISVFEFAHGKDEQARRADVVLLPGAGFDVVPSDCLAASLVRELPAATRLRLAFEAGGGPSPGTAKTSVEGLARGGCVRRDGKLKKVPLGWKTRTIPFAHAERTGVTIPWGDVYTAFVSTGVSDIDVFISVPPSAIAGLRRLRWIQPLLGLGFIQALLKRRIDRKVQGPSLQTRKSTDAQLWGEVVSADGRSLQATMTTPNGYELTVSASLGITEFLLENDVEGGYYTPSLLMGADFASTLPGVELRLPA